VNPFPKPAPASPADRQKVSRLRDGLDTAVAQRSTDLLYEFGISLNAEAGFPRDWSRMSSHQQAEFLVDLRSADPKLETLQRPWLWLAAVAEEAAQSGDLDLVVRVVMGVWLWSVEFAPKMNAGAFFEGVVSAPKSGSLAAVYSVVYRALASDPTSDRLRATAMHLAPTIVDKLGEEVTPEVRAAAWMFNK
jgi:hypothetical protein